jgi:structural maintenance of chromosomes protein 6
VGGSAEKITKDYENATARHAEAMAMLETEEKLAQLFRQTLNDREERWKLFRQKISARARATFVFVLSERSFHGHLKINHGRRKLEIAVQPDSTQRDRSGREASSLSGGEKSYSTICLLLSLWDAVGAPIRCLDEFDVYMDSVNRDISMKLLVRAARNAVGRQFILISPQAGIVDSSPDVKIIRLRDPERNQTRLNIGNQAPSVDT